jgi:superfamily II DNA or RNA helicase/HKD family nuclease
MTKLQRGLYEQLVTEALEAQLSELDARHKSLRGRLHGEEAADRIALHLGALVRRVISGLDSRQRTSVGLELARQIVHLLDSAGKGVDATDAPSPAGDLLQAIAALRPDGTPEHIPLPATPLLDTTLLTNAPGEPRIGFQLQSEVPSADRIDILMAFVRRSGIQPLLDLLRQHKDATRPLRLLTTTYTSSTELSALQALRDLGADIRVSYDTSSTRLHAKAWLFHRSSGYSTAYIGSSNLTHSAQVTGLEWNVRVSGARNPDVIDKFSAVFDSYWNNEDFRPFDEAEFRELTQTPASGPRIYLSPVEIRPEPFQSRLLEQIELSRLQGRHRNLLVSATGTGKTVMAALDYQRLRQRLPRARLLFIAHRKEILDQSLATFRHALRDAAFGELWVGANRPIKFDHVFASVQSLAAAGMTHIEQDHFDVVIIDEFHHAAASTYKALLEHLNPIELLALTATPERSDEEPILQWFDGRIAAELRLWDAIDQHRLSPFAYYGISDGVDYRGVTWRRGRGYDPQALSNLVTGDYALARLIIANVGKVAPNPDSMRALGFCVSVAHAQFMADQFNRAGLPAVAVWADTPTEQRRNALQTLAAGDLRVVFSVDLFNEGVDIPSVDTLLLLRPTDSPTVFLQQLGRGLRRETGKSVCTVLDFVGQHCKEFQFYRRFGALLNGSRKQVEKQIEDGFPFLPSGCHMQLDAVAAATVLENIRQSLPSKWPAKARELKRIAETISDITLKRFLEASGLELEDVYSSNHCWSDLLEAGGVLTLPNGPAERALRRALGRLLHLDDEVRIGKYRSFAQAIQPPSVGSLDLRTRRLFHMLATTVTESVDVEDGSLDAAASLIWKHPQVLAELDQLMEVLADRIDHVQVPLSTHPDAPLYVHARYTRREILAAFGDGTTLKLPEWREGVRWLPDANVDLLAFTLDKTSGHFSPTTRYRDYAISRELIHWESQSGTRADSETGRRYQKHEAGGSAVLPFARLTVEDRAFWLLGPAIYVSHEGERPMGIMWRLDHPLPGDLYARFAAAVS